MKTLNELKAHFVSNRISEYEFDEFIKTLNKNSIPDNLNAKYLFNGTVAELLVEKLFTI